MDVLKAEASGRERKTQFIDERLKNNSIGFFDPVKKNKLLTMEANNKPVKLTSSEGKLIQYREQDNIALQLMVKSQLLEEPIDLRELMKYALTPVPHCLGTPDGFLAKMNKASKLHFLLVEFTDEVLYLENAFYVQDGNAMIHALKDIPHSFGGICLKLLDHMTPKKNFIFSTDSGEAPPRSCC